MGPSNYLTTIYINYFENLIIKTIIKDVLIKGEIRYIETLPAEYEDLAKIYLPALKKMNKDELLAWLDYLRKNDEQQV